MKHAIVLLADGFEEIEALTPVDLLRRAGVEVTTLSVSGAPIVTGSHGIAVTADRTGLSPEVSFDLVLLPGGMPGAKHLDASPVTDSFLAAAKEKGAVIAAICAAPFVLGKRGLLQGKAATCYPGFEADLQGATVVDRGVVSDGDVITASAMGTAEAFALVLVARLCGEETAEKVRASIHPRPDGVDIR